MLSAGGYRAPARELESRALREIHRAAKDAEREARYTLYETAKLSDMNPKEYVRSALYRAINGAPALLPNELQIELDDALAPVASAS